MEVNIQSSKKVSPIHDNLESLSKEELITKIKGLEAHNVQLRNILSKSSKNHAAHSSSRKKPFDFMKCNYRHILLKFYYLGWDYQGFACQEDSTNTIEHYLFKALTKTCLIKDRASSNYHRCGRTDKGVSAFNQVISITVRSRLGKDCQDNLNSEIQYCKVLNRILPDNIRCLAWCPVQENFSARFDCKRRTYKYFFPKGNLSINRMIQASKYLIGTHDFRNLCKMDVGNNVTEFVRNISDIEIKPVFNDEDLEEFSMYVITITGNAFLWHQIRCMMGVLFLIGQGKEDPEVILELLNVEKNDRKPGYYMASEVPLILYSCDYENVAWSYDLESLVLVANKLKEMCSVSTIKTAMMKSILDGLKNDLQAADAESLRDCSKEKCLSEFLIQGVKSKNYVPLMKRQKCMSLEDKMKYFSKRRKVELAK